MPKLPLGLYDTLLTNDLQREIERLDSALTAAQTEPLDKADAHIRLARHMATMLRQVLTTIESDHRPAEQLRICNELLQVLRAELPDTTSPDEGAIALEGLRLTAVHAIDPLRDFTPTSPLIPLSDNDLLVNARGEPSIKEVLSREIASADRIDLLIAFIKWNGYRLLEEPIKSFVESGRPLRVITTTYIGATERRVIDHLVSLGAKVKVSYDTRNTRLHAKAWLFYRNTGFSTAFIGSSNLSVPALVDGLEWNVRISQVEAPALVEKFSATFESYWEEPDFESYDPETHHEQFDRAIAKASGPEKDDSTLVTFDLHPWPHQADMLDRLRAERLRHDRWKNLVVAATGTGKTVVAALDYNNLTNELFAGRPPSLLFVAHRREILTQSRATFRHAMRDGSFGELYVDGHRPDEWRHVFASVQSLSNIDLDRLAPDAFDIVIVDEFHHAAAPTYAKLLSHLRPRVLLGLTATPERTDGQPILQWFDGRIAVELRLWDALDRGLLVPFHYFGLSDATDLSAVKWVRGRYEERELTNLYTGNDARVSLVLAELRRKVLDVGQMRALGFCVGVSHAHFMADRFNKAGIPSVAVDADTSSADRDAALRKLKQRDLNCVFAVDLFNEGVDVPEIDTVLFLRPTESATVFLQQLGRGLRRTHDKDCLTVLDFIGNANQNFRFDLRYRALTGSTRAELRHAITERFPTLPSGCSIQLDRQSREVVLENLKQSIGSRFSTLVSELKSLGVATTLPVFLNESATDLADIYRGRDWSWTNLRVAAFSPSSTGVQRIADGPDGDVEPVTDREQTLLRAITRLLHTDDPERLARFQEWLARPTPPDGLALAEQRMLEGLLLALFTSAEAAGSDPVHKFWNESRVREELRAVFDILEDQAARVTTPLRELVHGFEDVPLSLHARYTRSEVLAAIGRSTVKKPFTHREGPLWHEQLKTDFFFVTLEKNEKHYSPSTRYRDYAISAELFHWESQSGTREATKTGQRYIHHESRGTHVMLFVRETNERDGQTLPFTFLGPMSYVKHTGELPMAITWRLVRPIPADLLRAARVAAG